VAKPADRVEEIVKAVKTRVASILIDVDTLGDIAQRLGADGPKDSYSPAWYGEPATDDQIEKLRSYGLEPRPGMRKEEAARILGRLKEKG